MFDPSTRRLSAPFGFADGLPSATLPELATIAELDTAVAYKETALENATEPVFLRVILIPLISLSVTLNAKFLLVLAALFETFPVRNLAVVLVCASSMNGVTLTRELNGDLSVVVPPEIILVMINWLAFVPWSVPKLLALKELLNAALISLTAVPPAVDEMYELAPVSVVSTVYQIFPALERVPVEF